MAENQKTKSGRQIAGFILGLLSVLFAWTGGLAIYLSIAGIIFSALGMKRTNLRGLAVSGLILSILGLVFASLFFAVIYPLFTN